MDLERGLQAWQAAGLIDAATADAIRDHEGAARTPWGRWAVIALGLLAVALGIALVIASNWQAIPGGLKLGVHLLLTVIAAAVAWRADRLGQLWTAEGALFLLGALVLGGIALQTQIFQLVGESWQALWFWLALTAPVLVLMARSRLNGYALALMAGWAALALGTGDVGALGRGIALAVPAALLGLSAIGREAFATGLREAGLAFLLGGASLAHIAWSVSLDAAEVAEAWLPLAIGAALSLIVLGFLHYRRDPAAAIILPSAVAAIVAVVIALGIPHGGDWPSRLAGAIVYALMWGVIGWVAFRAGWTKLFGVAVAALALRLFIIYFEIFASLAMTGAGLIGAGLLLIALVLLWRRLVVRLKAT